MEALILCGGYARRLSPLTDFIPKALLPIDGKPVLDHIIEAIGEHVDSIIISANAKFRDQFEYYVGNRRLKSNKRISVLVEPTTEDENRLGVVGGFSYALEQAKFKDDVLFLAGDKIYELDTTQLTSYLTRTCYTKITILLPSTVGGREGTSGLAILPKAVITNGEFLNIVRACAADTHTKDSMLDLIKMVGEEFNIEYSRIEGKSIDLGVRSEYEETFKRFLRKKLQNGTPPTRDHAFQAKHDQNQLRSRT